jgi:signal transduction histidine kinase/DNA-binding response OmpR family regulator
VKLEQAIQLCMADGTPYDLELQGITAKNKLLWTRAIGNSEFQHGKCVRLFGVIQNINDKKIAELEKGKSELRLSLATKAGGVGVFDWDIVNNNLIWDDQMFALYGVKREEFSNAYEAWINGIYEADRERAHMEGEIAVKNKKEYNSEFRVQHPNGQIRSIKALSKIIRDEEGNALRMIGANWDITDEKDTLKQVEEAKEQAERASKAKSEFLANMSHEIRTTLNGVIGFTDLLKKTPLSSVQQEYVNNANVSGQTLLSIINDILDFSKIEAGMFELDVIKTDMVKLLENSIDIVKYSADEKGLNLLLDIDSELPRYADADPVRLNQILANLLSNAVKFTKKGEVELKVDFQALDDEQGKLSISVRDTGIGISDEQKEKLFKPFSQADTSTTRKFGGTGLGLVISELIAEKMGSKININSTTGVGSTFFFDVTLGFEEEEKIDPTQIKDVTNCLIIDHSLKNRQILEKILRQWHIESDSCDNGLEAIKKMETSENRYDVIICNYDMPYMNGIETMRMMKDKLKLNIKKQPVILLQSSAESIELNEKCEELGIRFRLNKPVRRHDLFNNLTNLHKDLKPIPQKETEQKLNVSETSEKIKILIAEDNDLNMLLSKTLILGLMPNIEIYEAKNGREAIEQYKKTAPNLIFMDIHMPELNGLEAPKRIREMEKHTNNHLPIIALTAGALKVEKEKCIAAGMDDFLAKPLESQKIQTALNKYCYQEKKVTILQNIDAKDEVHFGFRELLVRLRNKMNIFQKLATIAMTEMPEKINQLEQACHEIDLAEIKSTAHYIRGTSLNMRFHLLAEIAGKMESNAENNTVENIHILLSELKEEWQIIKKLFSQKIEY